MKLQGDTPASTLLKKDENKKMDTIAKVPARSLLIMSNTTLGIKLKYEIVSLSDAKLVLQTSEATGTRKYYLSRY